jgi:hypothetical protein
LKKIALVASAATALVFAASLIVTPAASQQAYGPGPGPGYSSSTNLAGGYANSPGYAYGPGPGPAYGPGPGPGYAYGSGYMAGPPHEPGGPVRNGNLCWSDRDPWGNTGQGYWKPC